MSAPELEKFAGRPFSFYPPILGIEHNEWTYRKSTWSEVLVHNTKTGLELWVPRRHLGEISRIDEPVMIVGLNQELEYKAGAVRPYQRRVVTMPLGAKAEPAAETERPEPPPPKRRGTATERKIWRLILSSLVVAIVGTFLVVFLFRGRESGGRINYKAILQAELGLTAEDDYYAVLRKLGSPAADRWRADTGERQYRALEYPKLGLTVILMGPDRDHVFYIGAKDKDWKTVHSVTLPGGGSTDSILRSLKRF